jgi:putative transposase
MRSDRRRVVVKRLQVGYCQSERRVCRALNFPQASHRYKSVRDERTELRIRLRDLAGTRVHYGYRRLHILLSREGWHVNHKLVYRLYVEEGLQMRQKRPRQNRSRQLQKTLPIASHTNEGWRIDFMSVKLFNGQ